MKRLALSWNQARLYATFWSTSPQPRREQLMPEAHLTLKL